MAIFNFYHFLPILDPFWPFVIFWVNFLYSVICAYINCVIMQKIALINGISMGIFNFYHFFDLFWTLFDLFLAFFVILGQFSIDCHMRIYKLCNHPKNCTHKWYFYGHFYFLPFFTYFGPFLTLFYPF